MESVGVVRFGYVGLPLAMTFAEAGLSVTGIEKNVGKIFALEAEESHV